MLSQTLSFLDNIRSERIMRRHSLTSLDIAIAVAIAAVAVAETLWGMSVIGTGVWKATSFNLWYQADTPRVIANFTQMDSNHYRASVHPMAPTLLTLPIVLLEKTGLTAMMAAQLFMCVISAASAALCFVALRFLDLPRLPATAFTGAFLGSASFVYWSAVPELNSPAMLSILVALTLFAHGGVQNRLVWILASAATMGITITNWSIGLIATFVQERPKRFIQISAAALLLVFAISVVQSLVFRASPILFLRVAGEYRFTQVAMEKDGQGKWNPLSSTRSLFLTTISAPYSNVERQTGDLVITNQDSGFFARSSLGIAVAISWIAVLSCGAYGAIRNTGRRQVALGLGLMIAFQLMLHCIYGDPTFLYAPHFLPLLIMGAAFSWFSPMRWAAVGFVIFVSLAGFVDNAAQFRSAAGLANQIIIDGGNTVKPLFPAGGAVLP